MVARERWANRATSTLAVGIGAGALTLTVAAGEGARFPSLGAPDEFFWLTLEAGGLYAPSTREIVRVTAVSGDVFTVVRGQQGTSASAFLAGARVEARLTGDTLTRMWNRVYETTLYSRYTPPTGFHGARATIDDPFGLFNGNAVSVPATLVPTSQFAGQYHQHWASSAATTGVRGQSGDAITRGNAAGIGGFRFEGKVGLDINNSTTREYFGLVDLTGAFLIAGTNPSAASGNALFGFGYDDGLASGNLRFFHNDGTGGPVTNVDSGITRANMLVHAVYFLVYAAPHAASIRMVLKDLVTGTGIDQTVSSNIPPATTGLVWQFSGLGNGGVNSSQVAVSLAEGRPFAWGRT